METLLVFTNLPDIDAARAMAERLVEQRLAACVNILAPCRSTYRWRGEIEHAQEVPLLIKTTTARYAALEAAMSPSGSLAGFLTELRERTNQRLWARVCETAGLPLPGTPARGGTVYLSTADAEGNMVSLIQSNYMGFGSGLVVPGTGIALHNRGNNFSLDAAHPNCIAPGKRPYHTIIPGFLTRGGAPVGPFGVMGGFMQPQGHVQVVMNSVDFQLNPQAALDAPRWEWESGRRVQIEHSTAEHLFRGLAARGHEVNWQNNRLAFGRGQIIWRDATGVLCGGTEPRTDGAVVGW